jgi:SAM-dependent methyltransferase
VPAEAALRDVDATYTYGHTPGVVAVHARRSAAREAGFFLPHLRPGMRLLDAGCGPGSITVGLASAVAPGDVVGVDFSVDVLEEGRALAAERGLTNLRFEAADVLALPFPDASFDAVFAHTLLEHVGDGVSALRELRRVLRPGGVIGVRDCDWASGVFAPDDDAVAEAMALYERVWRQNGGHPRCGRYLRGLLGAAGFAEIRTSASFRWDGSAEESRAFGELLAHRLALPNFAGPIVESGWCDGARLEQIIAACLAWSRHPDAFAEMVMVEAVGRAPAG